MECKYMKGEPCLYPEWANGDVPSIYPPRNDNRNCERYIESEYAKRNDKMLLPFSGVREST